MLRELSNVRRRVEQLATQARSEGCGGDHQRLNIVTIDAGESVPPWPEPGAEKRCACGAELVFFQIVNTIRAGLKASSGTRNGAEEADSEQRSR